MPLTSLREGGITKIPQNHAPGMAKTRHLSEALLASGAPDKWQRQEAEL